MGFQYSNLMQFDSLTFQQKILIDGFNGLGTVDLSLISGNPRSRFMLKLILLLCLFWVLKRVARSQLLRLFDDGSDNTALLSWFLLKIRYVRILDTIVCSGSLVWLFSPAWNAIKLTQPGCWLHLAGDPPSWARLRCWRGISGHAAKFKDPRFCWLSTRWPILSYRTMTGIVCWPPRIDDEWIISVRSYYGCCSKLAPGLMFDNFLPIPDAESLPFYLLVLKLDVCIYLINIPFAHRVQNSYSRCSTDLGLSISNDSISATAAGMILLFG